MRRFLLILALITITFGTIYAVGQQIVRQSADEPAQTLAQNIVNQLNNGIQPDKLVKDKVNMATSLSPFVIIYDKSGKPIAGNGYLHDQLGVVPYGVLTHADQGRGNHVTWQPETGVRIASVTLLSINGDYVLAGHNLGAVEHLENQLFWLTALGWGLAMALTVVLYPTPRRFMRAKD